MQSMGVRRALRVRRKVGNCIVVGFLVVNGYR
jgi:hypothetical protein